MFGVCLQNKWLKVQIPLLPLKDNDNVLKDNFIVVVITKYVFCSYFVALSIIRRSNVSQT